MDEDRIEIFLVLLWPVTLILLIWIFIGKSILKLAEVVRDKIS